MWKQVEAVFDYAKDRETATCPFCGQVVLGEYPPAPQRGYLTTHNACEHFNMWAAGWRHTAVAVFVGLLSELQAMQAERR